MSPPPEHPSRRPSARRRAPAAVTELRRRSWPWALALAPLLMLLGCARTAVLPAYPPGPELEQPKHRGGHAVFVREEDPDFLDPALSYGTYTGPVIETVFRTLLDYANTPGMAGTRLVPELAQSLPDVREGGTLYCFRVRRDARFSAPLRRHITAADFKYAMERLYKVGSPGCNFYRGIVGVRRVLAGQDSVIPGIIARGDSLYFRLERPDPIFTSVLALPFTAPVPREVIERHPNDFSQHTVATGPFMITEFVPRRRVVLVRNPNYCGEPAWLDTLDPRLGVSPPTAGARIRQGVDVTLYGWTVEPGPRELALVQQQLTDVGIRVRLDLGETAGYTSMAENVSNHVAFGIYGWYADYVDASNFFDPLLNGHRIQAIHNINLSLFGDSKTNEMIERAMATPDDSARIALYRKIDRRVMDLAPVAPMIHLYESRLYSPRLGGWYRHVTRLIKLEQLYLKSAPREPPVATRGSTRPAHG